MIDIRHRLPPTIGLGLVRAEAVRADAAPPGFERRLAALLERRRAPLLEAEEVVRRAVRDMLRQGRYKPTGRGKPASEYLLRAAGPGHTFPRINAVVDVANAISVQHLVPISLWDLTRAEAQQYVFRLGAPGERYAFNEAGQTIELVDLVVGCRLPETGADGSGEPIVNPVRDSLATKTTPATARVAACLYAPLAAVPAERLASLCAEFADLLAACGPTATARHAVLLPGESQRV